MFYIGRCAQEEEDESRAPEPRKSNSLKAKIASKPRQKQESLWGQLQSSEQI
jgi:hypothetical protein